MHDYTCIYIYTHTHKNLYGIHNETKRGKYNLGTKLNGKPPTNESPSDKILTLFFCEKWFIHSTFYFG